MTRCLKHKRGVIQLLSKSQTYFYLNISFLIDQFGSSLLAMNAVGDVPVVICWDGTSSFLVMVKRDSWRPWLPWQRPYGGGGGGGAAVDGCLADAQLCRLMLFTCGTRQQVYNSLFVTFSLIIEKEPKRAKTHMHMAVE